MIAAIVMFMNCIECKRYFLDFVPEIENYVILWDSLGPSPALALYHVIARLTVPYRSSVH